MGYTKGPWAVVVDESAAQVVGFPCIEADDYTVVGIEGMYGDLETDYANAQLIAAAPDMLEALEYLASAFVLSPDADWPDGDNPLAIAYAAIAKAKGETK